MNTLLMGALTVVVTMSESRIPNLLAWGIAAGLFAVMAVFNFRPIVELLKNAKGLLRGR